MAFAEIGGTVLHYELLGDADASRVLVFANSLGTDFRIWLPVFDELDDDLAILLYDKRGHGLSGLGKQPSTIEDHAQDVIDLCAYLDIKKAVFCGLSVGGVIAQSIWKLKPSLVEAMILCDTAHKIGTPEMWNSRIAAIEADGIASLSTPVLERWFTPNFFKNNKTELEGYRVMLERQSVAGYVGVCAALRDADFTESAKTIDVPVLCVVGDQDGSTPPDLVRELANLIPDADFEIIKGCGHIPCVEQPEALSRLINRFLSRLGD
jgi:3-oxoadipate enol-lactonase